MCITSILMLEAWLHNGHNKAVPRKPVKYHTCIAIYWNLDGMHCDAVMSLHTYRLFLLINDKFAITGANHKHDFNKSECTGRSFLVSVW